MAPPGEPQTNLFSPATNTQVGHLAPRNRNSATGERRRRNRVCTTRRAFRKRKTLTRQRLPRCSTSRRLLQTRLQSASLCSKVHVSTKRVFLYEAPYDVACLTRFCAARRRRRRRDELRRRTRKLTQTRSWPAAYMQLAARAAVADCVACGCSDCAPIDSIGGRREQFSSSLEFPLSVCVFRLQFPGVVLRKQVVANSSFEANDRRTADKPNQS